MALRLAAKFARSSSSTDLPLNAARDDAGFTMGSYLRLFCLNESNEAVSNFIHVEAIVELMHAISFSDHRRCGGSPEPCSRSNTAATTSASPA